MRRLCLILIVLLFKTVAFSPTDAPAPEKCPALNVNISPLVVNLGEIQTAATITNADPKDLKFERTIDGGIILEGQGKPEIIVQQLLEHAGKLLTVVCQSRKFYPWMSADTGFINSGSYGKTDCNFDG